MGQTLCADASANSDRPIGLSDFDYDTVTDLLGKGQYGLVRRGAAATIQVHADCADREGHADIDLFFNLRT